MNYTRCEKNVATVRLDLTPIANNLRALDKQRESDRNRQNKYRKNQALKRKKSITAYISPKAQQILDDYKKLTGKTYSEIVDEAITCTMSLINIRLLRNKLK